MYKSTFVVTLTAAMGFALLGCGVAQRPHGDQAQRPTNIILFIGDGMSVSQVTTAKVAQGTLNLERFSTVGLLTTHADPEFVTDSAAAATALATGYKTYYGAISVDADQKPLKTVLEYAEEQSMSTGLVATCALTHATPACFAAHARNRGMHTAIAEDIAESGVDVLLGGGRQFFLPQSVEGGHRSDGKDLLKQLEDQGMTVVRSADAYRQLSKTPDRLAGFFAANELPPVNERELSLAELTRKAIEILSRNDNGFFLMVEGSQIDWAGHENNKDYLLMEMKDFDDAVGAGLDFAARDGRTLIVVTADHETGGLSLLDGSIDDKQVSKLNFASRGHTAVMVPLFAKGPGSKAFGGIHDNTLVGQKLIEYVRQR